MEACFAPDGTKIVEKQVYQGDTRCNELYPSFASPRIVAGGPVASDVVTCQLREPVREDYPTMTDQQWQHLREVFPSGVCDYSKPGVDETGIDGTWIFFEAPGEWTAHEPRAFEPAPTSAPATAEEQSATAGAEPTPTAGPGV